MIRSGEGGRERKIPMTLFDAAIAIWLWMSICGAVIWLSIKLAT